MRRLLTSAALLALVGCATTGPTAPPRELPPIESRSVRGTDRFRVVTTGLDPEVAVEGVRTEDKPIARTLLEATLQALPVDQAPRPGAIVDLRFGSAEARVQLVSAAGNALLVVDVPPTGASVHPTHALATAAFGQAQQAWEAGGDAEARRLALASVRLHPGDPLLAGEDERPGSTNRQNHMAWALLAQLSDGAERLRWYVGALERSSAYLEGQLGAHPAALSEQEREELFSLARTIVDRNLEAMEEPTRRGGLGGPVEFPSPIWSAGDRQTVLLPEEFLGLYARDPARSLLQEESTLALAVDAFERLRSDPVELLLATREIRSIYLREELFPGPTTASNQGAGPAAEKMLSALLADVARKAAAGLNESEIAATLGEDAEPRTQAAARAKLAAQRNREATWYGAALQSAAQ